MVRRIDRTPSAVAAVLALVAGLLTSATTPSPVDANELFSRPLVIPAELTGDHVTLVAQAADVEVLAGEPTRMWTFNGTFPGPTIRRRAGQRTEVTVVNDLPAEAGSITVHNHGNHSASAHDGQPAGEHVIPVGGQKTYVYDLTEDGAPQRGALQWYHDHSHHRTGRNVWMGLAGMFIVEDEREEALNLPSGEFDVPLLIADRRFDADNQLVDAFTAPSRDGGTPGHAAGQPHWPPADEFPGIGDRVLVNGVPEPYFEVGATAYRLRLLNASNFRPINVALSNGQSLTQVGTESGLLPAPVQRDTILLGPAERADVVVDFSGASGQTLYLESVPDGANTSLAGTGRLQRTEPAVLPIMEFRVGDPVAQESTVPSSLRPLPTWVADASPDPQRVFAFGLGADEQGRPSWTINGRVFDPDRIEARPEVGSVETWMLVNTTGQPISHYIHIHHTDWYLLSRNGRTPTPGEQALKETFRLDPGEYVVVAAKFSDHLGRFMFHCHMLEHEDHGMMASFEVVPEGEGDAPAIPDGVDLPSLDDVPDPPELDDLPGGPGDVPWLGGPAQVLVLPSGATGGFTPSTAYHAPGEQAQLHNLEMNTHDVTADTRVAGVPLFQSDIAGFGKSVPIVGTERLAPGTYGFHCSLHPGMTGKLVVG